MTRRAANEITEGCNGKSITTTQMLLLKVVKSSALYSFMPANVSLMLAKNVNVQTMLAKWIIILNTKENKENCDKY